MHSRRNSIALAIAFFLTLAACSASRAQDWPTRPVTMVVPYAAGGPVDTVGRIMAAALSDVLRQQVVVENSGGAGGMTGAARVAKSPPDGSVFLLGGLAVLAQVPSLYRSPLYDPVADFAPVSLFADQGRILIVRKDLPVDSLAAFVEYVKANHARMQFASAGAGSGLHICAALINAILETSVAHVPYRGSALAMQDLLAGRIDFMCEQVSTAFPLIQSGAVKAIATLGPARPSVLPDLPTAPEQGLGDLDCSTWSAFVFPKGTPDAIVRRLVQATSDAVDSAFVRDRFAKVGVDVAAPDRRSPEYLAAFTRRELDKWTAVIRRAGVAAD
jgi:tripartite-type tricarboxylate transporter receptor subunit TctC